MGKLGTYKRGLGNFISSEKGQRFFNFAYSLGAAVVIWGALFKILHLPGGNALLSIGMGTEVLMFVLSAFDRPPKEYKWEDVFPALKDKEAGPGITGNNFGGGGGVIIGGGSIASNGEPVILGEGDASAITGGGNAPVIIGGGTPAGGAVAGATGTVMPAADLTTASQQYLDQMNSITEEMQHLRETTAALNEVSSVLLDSYRSITENSTGISESSQGYVDQMQNLYRNLGGLNTIYELQLRSVSSQIDAIDRVNRGIKDIRDMYEKSANQSARYCEETEKMARYMQQLNSIYERMIAAMTVNMYRPGMAAPDINGMPVATDIMQQNNAAENAAHAAAQKNNEKTL